ncbi:hypothetical protein M758_3G019100 [Ceratodon purpureus]|nr:hypothetical protein M758_3G019100 [Ceratodon purpureus]
MGSPQVVSEVLVQGSHWNYDFVLFGETANWSRQCGSDKSSALTRTRESATRRDSLEVLLPGLPSGVIRASCTALVLEPEFDIREAHQPLNSWGNSALPSA